VPLQRALTRRLAIDKGNTLRCPAFLDGELMDGTSSARI
jgi:hypothetical protein